MVHNLYYTMSIYLFFKQYFVYAGKGLAIYLHKKWVSPNVASIGSLLVIFPMFYIIGKYIESGWIFAIVVTIAILIKLILNAVDGIIARERNESAKLGMMLNVGTDIGPDMYIIFMILSVYGMSVHISYILLGIIGAYLLGEFVFIVLFGKQNLFFGKDLRTAFYIFLAMVLFLQLNPVYLVYFYSIIAFIHVWGFFLTKYRT